jgi:hypothetical protein
MLHVSESRMQAAFANVEGLHFARRWFKIFELFDDTHTESVNVSVTLFCVVRYTPGFKKNIYYLVSTRNTRL